MTGQIEKHLTANMHISKKNIMFSNFLGGLAWGLGTVIGATIIATIAVAIFRFFNFIPGFDQIINLFPKK